VFQSIFDEARSMVLLHVRQVAAQPLYTCGRCGIDVGDVHEEFFRRKGEWRAVMRGKRWLLLTRRIVGSSRRTTSRSRSSSSGATHLRDRGHPLLRELAAQPALAAAASVREAGTNPLSPLRRHTWARSSERPREALATSSTTLGAVTRREAAQQVKTAMRRRPSRYVNGTISQIGTGTMGRVSSG
jgi:hypothetical protein